MKQLSILCAVMVLTLMAFWPAAARADEGLDDLDVTMIVLDDPSELDGAFAEMDGPDDDGVRKEDWEGGESGGDSDGDDDSSDDSEDESD